MNEMLHVGKTDCMHVPQNVDMTPWSFLDSTNSKSFRYAYFAYGQSLWSGTFSKYNSVARTISVVLKEKCRSGSAITFEESGKLQ